MPTKRLLLRITLALLAAAAFSAVLAVFTGSSMVLWRIVLTCIEGSVATGILVQMTRLLDRREQRPAAMVGLVTLLATFWMVLMTTWADVLGFNLFMQLIGTATATAVLGGVVTGATAAKSAAAWQRAWPVTATLAAAMWVGIAMAIWLDLDQLGTVSLTAGTILLFGSLCLVGTKPEDRPWRYLGVLFAIAGAAIAAKETSMYRAPAQELWRIYSSFTAGTIGLAFANLLVRINMPGNWVWLRRGTVAAALVTAGGAAYLAVGFGDSGRWDSSGDALARLTAAAGILTVCGTLAIALKLRLGRRVSVETTATTKEFTGIDLACPRCRVRQVAPIGDSFCAGCRLVLSVRTREPLCAACGYSLLDLATDACPECGESIPKRGVAFEGVAAPSSPI
ncbi:MAG: hypothetical protein KF745_13705 [Phycisphaeraceae bacterium]|nr:hypothetical protein [Phycisphaeraceae bacterium]